MITLEYIEALKRGMGYDDSDLENACLDILTETEEYPISFIEFETSDLLGIKHTRSNGTEGFVILNKKYITSIAIVYEGDITIDVIKEDKSHEISYN